MSEIIKECGNTNVRKTPLGEGLFAAVPFKADERIVLLEGPESDTPDRYSVQLGPNKHIMVGHPGSACNHACAEKANIRVEVLDDGRAFYTAVRDIVPDEELRFDYNTNETAMAEPFECSCGSAKCVGTVKGSGKK